MGKVILYANGNSENHGCEALTRTVAKLFEGSEVVEFVSNPSVDERYGLSPVVRRQELETGTAGAAFPIQLAYKAAYKLRLHNVYNFLRYRRFLRSIEADDVALSIGGDNYCYADTTWLQSLNYWIGKRCKTVLLGVSIEPKILEDAKLRKDLSRYSLILARESLTYESLCKNGLEKNTRLVPDSAFLLETEETALPENFLPGNTVGINISPMIMSYEENQGAAYHNYEELVRYILENTEMSVALIPHVVWKTSDDRVPLKKLYDSFASSGRVCMIEDQNCMRLKYVISQCRFFVGARTHATIAAYSSSVPTLVVGYSVKAKGIARDLFGSEDGYVLPVQHLCSPGQLKNAFRAIYDHEEEIRQHLKGIIPDYCADIAGVKEVVEALFTK